MHAPCIRTLPLLVVAAGAALACGMPRDAEGTLERVRRTGVLRAGAVPNPPFVVAAGGALSGSEVAVVEAFAETQGAAVAWIVGPEAELVERLEHFRLDLVAGGITKEDPHAKKVGTSLPLDEPSDGKPRVLLAPPGESRFLAALDRAVYARRAGRGPPVAAGSR